MAKYKKFLGLGIAGNFALHLAQAGELEEFKDIITADEAAPKGIFPFYLPRPASPLEQDSLHAKEILTTYPLSSDNIKLPNEDVNVQAEPEVGLICDLEYHMGILSKITPTYFGAYNDCSIRVAGAKKISDKKKTRKALGILSYVTSLATLGFIIKEGKIKEVSEAAGTAVGGTSAAVVSAKYGAKFPGPAKIGAIIVAGWAGGCMGEGECNPIDTGKQIIQEVKDNPISFAASVVTSGGSDLGQLIDEKTDLSGETSDRGISTAKRAEELGLPESVSYMIGFAASTPVLGIGVSARVEVLHGGKWVGKKAWSGAEAVGGLAVSAWDAIW